MIPVEYPPKSSCCNVTMEHLDTFEVSWQYRCPACGRAFQMLQRPIAIGWAKAWDFRYQHAPRPQFDIKIIAEVVDEDEEDW